MAGYNCGRIAADGIGTCYGQLSSSGSCEPCDSNLEANTGIQKTRGVPSRGSLDYGPRGQRQAFRGFTGTNWQQDTPGGTNWQQKGVFNNWSGSSLGLGTDSISTPTIVKQTTTTTTEPKKAGLSPVSIVLSMLSVGVLFFVIGYSYEKGKTS